MSDWAGIIFFVVLIAGAYLGLRSLARPRPRSEQEFERNAAEGTTALGASMNALQEMMNPEEVMGKLVITDTSLIFNPDTYEDEVVITNSPVNPEDIQKYRVKEMWFFDEESSRMGVRILGIAPIKDYYDESTGEFKYAIPMFWVYYPEAREALSRYTVFNEFNDAAPSTWSDLFEQRRFSSYIYKQSNVLDLRLDDYYNGPEKGVERLMEGERIKSELFNWEHDLWTY